MRLVWGLALRLPRCWRRAWRYDTLINVDQRVASLRGAGRLRDGVVTCEFTRCADRECPSGRAARGPPAKMAHESRGIRKEQNDSA